VFLSIGGFSPKAGTYALMDLCLKARLKKNDNNTCIFLPELQMLKPHDVQSVPTPDAVFFFARWHGLLWDNEESLYQSEGITHRQLDTARMAQAQKQVNGL
jgi:hypothetical protein